MLYVRWSTWLCFPLIPVKVGWFLQVKFLPCIFLLGVSCAYRKDADDFRPIERCFTCSYYLRFMREMEEEEEKVHAEFDKIRKYGYPKSLGESGS